MLVKMHKIIHDIPVPKKALELHTLIGRDFVS